MRILVTGAAGCLGTELCLMARAAGHDVVGVDIECRYDLLGERGPVDQNANGFKLLEAGVALRNMGVEPDSGYVLGADEFDAVVHAAAQVCHSRQGADDDPWDDYYVNIGGTLSVLDEARERPTPVLFLSSAKIYGGNSDMAIGVGDAGITESCPLGDQTHVTFFGAGKIAADLFCQMYARKYGMTVGVLRPGCFTGRYALATEAQNWLPWLIHCAMTKKTFRIFGDGSVVRDILDSSDLASAVMLWLARPTTGVWNIGGGRQGSVTVREAIRIVSAMLGVAVKTERCSPRDGDIRNMVMDSSKFKREYDWTPRLSLEETIDRLIKEAKSR